MWPLQLGRPTQSHTRYYDASISAPNNVGINCRSVNSRGNGVGVRVGVGVEVIVGVAVFVGDKVAADVLVGNEVCVGVGVTLGKLISRKPKT